MTPLIDHGWASERDRGNRGGVITVAVSDADHGYYGANMSDRLNRIVTDVDAVTRFFA